MKQYHTKLVGKACVLSDVPQQSVEKIQAVKKKLEDRGKFPTGLVSQPDTLALQSVILTTGRPGNLNDDVMLNSEVLPILWTAALKPFNVEHTKFIVGCMFDAFAVNRDTGEVVPSVEKYNGEVEEVQINFEKLPENLDIITNQVLWSLHFPQEVASIKRKAIAGELFVSMEVWFTEFDYLVGNRLIKRTPELAEFMDAKLRINGGSGFFGIDRVKRVPRNLTFAGNAAVETPANPDSFILDVMDRGDLMDARDMESDCEEEHETVEANLKVDERIQAMLAENTICVFESLSDEGRANEDPSDVLETGRSGNHLGGEASSSQLASAEVGEVVTHSEEKNMPFDEQKFVEIVEDNAVLKDSIGKAEAALAEVNKENEELQARNAELEAKLEETLAQVTEKEEALAAKAEAFEKLEAENAELVQKLDETSATLTEIEEQRKLDTRKAALTELGLSEERVVKVLAKTAELDEEAFAAEVEDLKALMVELTPAAEEVVEEETPEVEETPEEVVEAAEEEEAPEATPEVEEVEASEEELAEVLEEAEEEEVPVAEAIGAVDTEQEEDEVSQIQSAMAKALGINLDK